MDVATRNVQQRLSAAGHYPEVVLLKPSTTSTNDDVKQLAETGVSSILVCSEQQTQGRGQHQKNWLSPVGNIYLSTLLETRTALNGCLALEIALNILQMPALKGLHGLQIKWPNDLYSAQGKWGGILVEPLNQHQVVVGVGINLYPLPDTLDQANTSLSQLGLCQIDRLTLISELYLAIQHAGQWFDHGCYRLAERFNHYAAFKDQAVQFTTRDQQYIQGIFIGIASDGSVKIQTQQGIEQFYLGQLRLQHSNETNN
ncbi:biotin--[acetyl-CoA-carboxylase] ligase [Acinetobacter larvae]|uniref:Biotin--[acetyl-CoA-carboxylase] ligase n=1 Tax=Acinetobacter larvae TaxID=1789224 RepID=A0A1B2LWW1_9GAMM|nr:biotin--[acetyl-CoA-carboxylase] ligase [Acinetobacter larvae]AOA57425.1 biotin--[acetyl-CoA-carboxylase] ligase [Acinetobacter larvae]